MTTHGPPAGAVSTGSGDPPANRSHASPSKDPAYPIDVATAPAPASGSPGSPAATPVNHSPQWCRPAADVSTSTNGAPTPTASNASSTSGRAETMSSASP